jgi:hypothetical protein
MAEKHLIHENEPVPFCCEQCVHFIDGSRCKAFDTIPLYYFFDAEEHDKVDEGQKGDYVFKTKDKRQFNRVYTIG